MRVRGLLVRGLAVALLCTAVGLGLWGFSAAATPESTPPGAPVWRSAASRQRIVLPRAAPLRLDGKSEETETSGTATPHATTVTSSAARPTPTTPSELGGLGRWAARASRLTGLGEAALANYASAELRMRGDAPGCHLSWVTLAGIGSAGSGSVHPAAGHHAALAAAREVCAGGHDTATRVGWLAAVRSVGGSGADTGYVQKVLAAATADATAMRSGVPIGPQARAAIDFAIAQIGLPYVWGGNGPTHGDAGFDCSGLTHAAYTAAGITLPRTADAQYSATTRVRHVRPGDLVFYGNPNGFIHHVGLYVGNGLMIDAPTFGQAVQVDRVRSPGGDFAGAGRPTH